MQTIKNFFFQIGKHLGIDAFLLSIGADNTFMLAIFVGLISLILAGAVIYVLSKISNKGLKITLIIISVIIMAILFQVYVEGCIAVIGKLGGLSFAKTV